MAENSGGIGSNGILGVIVGAVLVIGVIAFFMYGRTPSLPGPKTEITIKTPAAPAPVAPAPTAPVAPK